VNESSAEERLLAHLESLREHPPEAGDALVPGVIRTARWQATARPYMAAIGGFATAFTTGATVLMGIKGGT
jgi:hypothetical protein